jgi:hypothetical protein
MVESAMIGFWALVTTVEVARVVLHVARTAAPAHARGDRTDVVAPTEGAGDAPPEPGNAPAFMSR